MRRDTKTARREFQRAREFIKKNPDLFLVVRTDADRVVTANTKPLM